MLLDYQRGPLIHGNECTDIRSIVVTLEREMFLDGCFQVLQKTSTESRILKAMSETNSPVTKAFYRKLLSPAQGAWGRMKEARLERIEQINELVRTVDSMLIDAGRPGSMITATAQAAISAPAAPAPNATALRATMFPPDGKGLDGYPIQIKVDEASLPPQRRISWNWGDASPADQGSNADGSHT
jgi:hypothetical protein